MFIIPSKFKSDALINRCISSIRNFHEEPIVVVDNGSDNQEYLERIQKNYPNIFIERNEVSQYEFGALVTAFEKYEFDNYFLMHDSMFLNHNVSHIKNVDLLSIRYFNSWNGVIGANIVLQNGNVSYRYGFDNHTQMSIAHNWVKDTINHPIPYVFEGVFGSSFCCKKEILTRMKNDKVFNCIPKNKLESQAMERFLGIYFKIYGLNHSQFSLMGEHHSNPYVTKYITKEIVSRQ